MNILKRSLSFLAVPVILLALLTVVAGKSPSHSVAYVRAFAWEAYARITHLFPTEIGDKALEEELRQARSNIVDWRVKLIRSARNIEQLRAERDKLGGRVQRNSQVLAATFPVLKAAMNDGQSTVRFAGTVQSLQKFQQEIDGLVWQRTLETEALALKEEGLARLEGQQKQAVDALAVSERALEKAEHEIAILKTRRDHAAIMARTTELVATISSKLNAPHSALADGISDLREEVLDSEARNEAVLITTSTDMQPPGASLSRDHDRLGALQTIYNEVQSQKHAQGMTEPEKTAPTAKNAGDTAAFGCGR